MKAAIVVVLLTAAATSVTSYMLVQEVQEKLVKEMDLSWDNLKTLNIDDKPKDQIVYDVVEIFRNVPRLIQTLDDELQRGDYLAALRMYSDYKGSKNLKHVKTKSGYSNWGIRWSKISRLLVPVELLYDTAKVIVNRPDVFIYGKASAPIDLYNMSELVLGPNETDAKAVFTIKSRFQEVYSEVINTRRYVAFQGLRLHVKNVQEDNANCFFKNKTPQQVIYGLYLYLATMNLKEYALLNLALMAKYTLNKDVPTAEIMELKHSLMDKTETETRLAVEEIKEASAEIWKCDPKTHIEGKTYDQFKDFLQGYIENESRMHFSKSCKETCDDYQFTRSHCTYPIEKNCHLNRVCTGNLHDCQYIEADAKVCLADPPRRFTFIKYNGGKILGPDVSCSKRTTRRNSHWRLFYHCSNCFCLCDDDRSPYTVRHISLLPSESRIEENFIVTGIRFRIVKDVLSLQIEEGFAEPNGSVRNGSTMWKEVPFANKKKEHDTFQLNYLHRSLDLDTVKAGPNQVVTGVKFRRLGTHLNLELKVTHIYPHDGKLMPDTSYWISDDSTPNFSEEGHHRRRELFIPDPDIPTLSKKPSLVNSKGNQFIKFGPSSMDKDASQTVVPFLDIQEVRPDPPIWIQGVGIYHKNRPGFGGFVAPKITTYSIGSF